MRKSVALASSLVDVVLPGAIVITVDLEDELIAQEREKEEVE